MQPHVKLIKIIEATDTNKRKALMVKYKDDEILGALLELMCSPEFGHTINIDIKEINPEPTNPTSDTFIRFRSFFYKGDFSNLKWIYDLDEATRFAYLHVINHTDLGVSYRFITETYSLFNRFNYNEHPIPYGFPTFPCYGQLVPEDRFMVNIKVSVTVIPTYLDGRYCKEAGFKILDDISKLKLLGDFTGYIEEDTYHITNYYPESKDYFSSRIMTVEKAIEQVTNKINYVSLVSPFRLEKDTDVYRIWKRNYSLICKQDKPPVYGTNIDMIELNCNKLIKLKKVSDDTNTTN